VLREVYAWKRLSDSRCVRTNLHSTEPIPTDIPNDGWIAKLCRWNPKRRRSGRSASVGKRPRECGQLGRVILSEMDWSCPSVALDAFLRLAFKRKLCIIRTIVVSNAGCPLPCSLKGAIERNFRDVVGSGISNSAPRQNSSFSRPRPLAMPMSGAPNIMVRQRGG
jgi:hypothetical protein